MTAGNPSEPALKGRRLETPTRDTLLRHFADTERFSKIILGVEACLTLAALLWLGLGPVKSAGPWPWVAAGIGALGVFQWLPGVFFLNKKRLEDLRADVSFGVHNRTSLLALVQRVFTRLQLPPNATPVFVTRAKDINAQAVRCELLPGLRLFNGVYLNRAILHLLDEPELESVVGHELAHVFSYAPVISRSYLLHSACAGTVSFAATATIGHAAIALIAPLVLLAALDRVVAFPHLRLSRGIEFLCDDFGAKATGLLPALSAEFKIAAETEARQQVVSQMFTAIAQGTKVSLDQRVEDYETAVPFGRVDPVAVRAEMEKLEAARQQSDQGISLSGFLSYLGERDTTGEEHREAASEEATRLAILATLPLVPIDRTAYLQDSRAWTQATAERLVAAIEKYPDKVLFRVADEIADQELSHPGVSRRMLFLWRNQ